MCMWRYLTWMTVIVFGVASQSSRADETPESLAAKFESMDVGTLVELAKEEGDPQRGAYVFFKSAVACHKCHTSAEKNASPLGPDLITLGKDITYAEIIEAILRPSAKIRKGYETVTLFTEDGKSHVGLVSAEDDQQIILRDAANLEQEIIVDKSNLENRTKSPQSMMPQGLVSSLPGEKAFYDLVSYVFEVAHGGANRAKQLKLYPEDLIVLDDSINLNHAGILSSLGPEDFAAGKKIYMGFCKNCHGVDGNHPNLPTARAFSRDKLKFGADPYRMFMTLTKGNGLMAAMSHLSPKERYQVVHFIRQQLIQPGGVNDFEVDGAYLDGLPQGTGNGEFRINSDRDFGPVLGSQLAKTVDNGMTFRLPHNITLHYDLHRMRLAGVWRGGFLDLSQTQHYRYRGEGAPKISGKLIPGLAAWQWAFDGSFDISHPNKFKRGPVREDWLQYDGHYLFGNQAILSYGIHGRKILESINAVKTDELVIIEHALRVGPGREMLRLSVGQLGLGETPTLAVRTVSSLDETSGDILFAMIDDGKQHVVVAVRGDVDHLVWSIDEDNRLVLSIPTSEDSLLLHFQRTFGQGTQQLRQFVRYVREQHKHPSSNDPAKMIHGGPRRWPQPLAVRGELGQAVNGYALDSIPVPFENPWHAWLRTSAFDFLSDGRAVVSTYGGDVYIVSGIDQELQEVTWQRYVAGLFEPFGVRVVDDQIFVTCRDGIKRLHDFDRNGEADFVEAFWVDDDVSGTFHAFNFDLQTDSQGNFYLAKSGQYTFHRRPGAIMRIPPEGGRADVVAWGIRTPNGMGVLPDDRLTVSDNQGPWMPAGKISLVRPGSFLGCMPINQEQEEWLKARHDGKQPDTFEKPMIWMPQELDSSCGGQIWCSDERWGPLSGRLVHASYGKGRLYYLSLQKIGRHTQASIVQLPHQWDAGVMRLRVNPVDGQVYGTGLSGWQGPQDGRDGCLQRLRYTGQPVRLIDNVEVTSDGVLLAFNFEIDAETASQVDAWQAEMWNYLWSEHYGSDQFSVRRPGETGRDHLTIQHVQVEEDYRTVRLKIADLDVCDQALLEMKFLTASGETYHEQLYLTVHAIPEG